MTTLRLALPALLLAALAGAPAGPLRAQSGEEVMRALLDRYEERMAGVRGFTVDQEVLGSQSRTRFEPRRVDGHTVFVPRAGEETGAVRSAPASALVDLFALAERARRRGTDEADGETCHVVTITDFRGTDVFGGSAPVPVADFEPRSATFLVDVDELLLRRVEVRGTAGVGGERRDVAFTAAFRDYREVEGVVHPFRTDVSVEGLRGSTTPEEREQLRASLREMRARLEEMPERQREMVERMMGGDLEMMQELLASGTMEFTVRVQEVRVERSRSGGG